MRPLDGIRVLEISHYIAGPFCCQQLADLGADVLKVEPPKGEPARRTPPFNEEGESLYFASFNHNKRSLELDLRSPEAETILPELIRWADVLVTNYSTGVPERLNFGRERVKELNPRAVMVHISGFGSWSKMGDLPAFDPVIQAMSGLTDLVGDPAGSPYLSNILFGDIVTAQQAAAAVLSALHLRERTGEGSFVEVSMMRSLAPLLGDYVVQWTALGQRPTRVGNRQVRRFINAFQTADGGHLVIAPITPGQWKSFCDIIGRPEWGAPEITANRICVTDDDLRRDLEESTRSWMRQHSTEEAARILWKADIPCGPMWSIPDLVDANEKFNLQLFGKAQLVGGKPVSIPASPYDLGETAPEPARNKVPGVGEHSSSVLREIGIA